MEKATESLSGIAEPKLQFNEFEFTFSKSIDNLEMVIAEHCIATDQPWINTPGIKKDTNSRWKLSVEAGRHKTAEVAKWFNTKIIGGSAFGCSTNATKPDELNFAFSATLTLTFNGLPVKFTNLFIAQGNNGRNNWWIGSSQLHHNETNSFLYSDDKRIKLSVDCYGVNGFNFEILLGDWMNAISDGTAVTTMSIPGTHDTGTYKISKAKFGSRCQNYDIAQQLEDGIRFLDIRLKNNDNNLSDPLQLYHGLFDCNVGFEEVMKSCADFLVRHPSETILMSVKNEDQDEKISHNFIKYLKKYPQVYYKGNRLPTLSELRGKIIFLYRFEYNGIVGFEDDKVGVMFGPWADNASFDSKNGAAQKFRIEDNYKENDTHKKAEFVGVNLKKAASSDTTYTSTLFITFNSIGVGAHTPYQYAWGGGIGTVDPKMNPWLRDFTNYNGQRRLGIIPLDFYNNGGDNARENNLVINIVNSNFGREE